jgi:uncharacterized membrane protein
MEISVTPELCFARTADIENWPEWARDLETVTVLERDGYGRPSRANLVADLFGKEFDATVDFDFDKAPGQITFALVEARKLASLEGSFQFEPRSAGTLVNFRVFMTLVKPKADRIERMVSRKVETALSRDLRRHIERTARR